jgi:hypothetical protein
MRFVRNCEGLSPSLVAATRRVLQSRATLVRPGMALGGARSRVIINWLS